MKMLSILIEEDLVLSLLCASIDYLVTCLLVEDYDLSIKVLFKLVELPHLDLSICGETYFLE